MIRAVDAVGPSSTFDDIKCTRWFKYDLDDLCVNKSQFVPVIFEPPCIWLNFSFISVCHLTMFLGSGSLLVLSHLRLAHHTVLYYVVFVWRCALCLVRYCLHAVYRRNHFSFNFSL
jgi:hypothetical protein